MYIRGDYRRRQMTSEGPMTTSIAAHLEIIENAITPLGGYVENLGGNTTGWWFNLDKDHYALVTYADVSHEGDPADRNWMAGRYFKGEWDGEEMACHVDVSFDEALNYIRTWLT